MLQNSPDGDNDCSLALDRSRRKRELAAWRRLEQDAKKKKYKEQENRFASPACIHEKEKKKMANGKEFFDYMGL